MTLPSDFLRRPLAHRGLHDAPAGIPENSLAAIRAAVAAGYGIEIDVQPSSDGAAMVFHDATLDRMTGESGPVAGRDAAALGRITLAGTGETVPTLSQVLGEVAGRVPLLVEIKDQDGALGPRVGRLEHAVAEAVAGYEGPLALMSFNPNAVAVLAARAPAVPRGLTTCAFRDADWKLPEDRRTELAAIADYHRTGACFISHGWADLGMARVAELKGQGAAILCWTIRSPGDEAEARRVAQNITFEGYRPPLPAA